MQVKSDFTIDNTPVISVALRHFIFALTKNELHHSGSFQKRKKLLKAHCESELLNYSTLEYNLNIFFELLEDCRKTNDPLLYRFLKLQAGFCFIDEQNFHLLQITPALQSSAENQDTGAGGNQESVSTSSAMWSGMVGGHLIGLD